MVERLCRRYGTPLHVAAAAAVAAEAGVLQGPETEAVAAGQAAAGPAPAALAAASAAVLEVDSEEAAAAAARGAGGGGAPAAAPVSYYAFPTLEQLAEATEEALRDDGFGYRWVGGWEKGAYLSLFLQLLQRAWMLRAVPAEGLAAAGVPAWGREQPGPGDAQDMQAAAQGPAARCCCGLPAAPCTASQLQSDLGCRHH